MKKALFFMMIFTIALASAAMADPAYKAYYANRTAAHECEKSGDTTCAVANYLAAETAALKQDAEKTADDVGEWLKWAGWQRSNAGEVLILKYNALLTKDVLDKSLLEEAIRILEAGKVTSPDPAAMIKKNLKYCKTQLGLE
jgi:hypothetical protein